MSTTEYRARIINGEDDIEIVASDRSALSINQAEAVMIGQQPDNVGSMASDAPDKDQAARTEVQFKSKEEARGFLASVRNPSAGVDFHALYRIEWVVSEPCGDVSESFAGDLLAPAVFLGNEEAGLFCLEQGMRPEEYSYARSEWFGWNEEIWHPFLLAIKKGLMTVAKSMLPFIDLNWIPRFDSDEFSAGSEGRTMRELIAEAPLWLARSESIGLDIGPSTERCIAKADEILAAYLFGNEVTVVDHDNWNTDDPEDFTKIVYVSYEDSPPEADSHKVSFHVRFDKSESVTDGYALDMAKGCDIGCRGDLHA